MSQLAIYLDEETARMLDRAAKKEGVSRSAWAREAIRAALRNRLPESFFEVLGSWEDGRSAEEILEDIRQYPQAKETASFD